MGKPPTREEDPLISGPIGQVPEGQIPVDVLTETVAAVLETLRELLAIVDRLEGEVSDLRRDLASTRKIAKKAKKKAGQRPATPLED
jgi:hypothetical protein